MKIFAPFFLLFAVTASAASIPWENLESDARVTLTQNLDLLGTHGENIRLAANTPYTLVSVEPLDGLGVVDYIFSPAYCNHPDVEADLTLILPAGTPPNAKAEVGVYFLKECQVEVMVEAKDLSRRSFYAGRPGFYR